MSQQTPHATPTLEPRGIVSPLRMALTRAKAHAAMVVREAAIVAAEAMTTFEKEGELAADDAIALDLVKALVVEANEILALPSSLNDSRPPYSVIEHETPMQEIHRSEMYRQVMRGREIL